MNNHLVDSIDQISHNVLTLNRYGTGSPKQRKFHHARIKNGKLFVVLRQRKKYLFAPSKFSGYRNNTTNHLNHLRERDGRVTNGKIKKLLGNPLDVGAKDYQKIDDAYLDYCSAFQIVPSRHHRPRRYWLIKYDLEKGDIAYPDDVPFPEEVLEGAKFRIFVNKFERSTKARRKCLQHYGYDCCVCGFNFEERYGDLGLDYIHVHHIIPLADIGDEYCPSSKQMGLLSVFHKGGSGSSLFDVKPLGVDGSSGGFGWSVF